MTDQLPVKLLELFRQLNLTDKEFFEIFSQIDWHSSDADDSDSFLKEIQRVYEAHDCSKNSKRIGTESICAICRAKLDVDPN